MTNDVVEEVGGVFVLPLRGFVCGGFEDGLALEDGFAHVELILHNQEFTDVARVRIEQDPDRPLIVSLAERRVRVERAVASPDSTLRVEFEGGESLEVPPGDYEAWQVTGPGRVMVVSPAGGGEPAIWDATSKTDTIRPGDPVPPEVEESLRRLFGEEEHE